MRFLLAVSVVLISLGSVIGAEKNDPLRFVPRQANAFVKVERPRHLIESIVRHDLAREAQELQFVRQFLDGADARRFFQLVAYYERDLGSAWPELIDKLAGNGIVLALESLGDNAPAMLVVDGTDEKVVSQFFDLALKVVEEEAERQGGPVKIARNKVRGADVAKIGDLFIARYKSTLLLSNRESIIGGAIELSETPNNPKSVTTDKSVADAKALLPADPLAWLRVNLKPLKDTPQAKELFESPRNNIILTALFAGYLDMARRSDFLTAGLYFRDEQFRLTIRMPAGRDDMAKDVELHLARDSKDGGTLPLLKPKGYLLSHSFYLDIHAIFRHREAILPVDIAKGLDEGEKQLSRFLLGTTLPKYISQHGVHHRIVVAQPEKVPGLKKGPKQELPSFAFVTSMRDPAFAKTTNSLIRAGALALGQQATLRSFEDELAGVPVFGYSFPENGKFPDDPDGNRFNYQPTFAVVQDQYIAASNKGLCREVIELVKKEDRSKKMSQNMQAEGSARGLGDFINLSPEQTLSNVILGQALPLSEARGQSADLIGFLQKLGTANVETDYGPKTFRFDITWSPKSR